MREWQRQSQARPQGEGQRSEAEQQAARARGRSLLQRGLCALLSVLAALLAPLGSARAELVPTGAAIAAQATSDRAAIARSELRAYLGREDVRGELVALGIAPAEAQARVAALSDAEVVAIQSRLRELPAGGATFVAVVGGFLLVTITILVVTDLLGYTDVFPFIKPLPRPAN